MGEPVEVVRWYTHARRFPLLLGRAGFNGGRIPGGPYTIIQVVIAVCALMVLKITWGLWAHLGVFTNFAVLLGVPAVAGFAAGKLPSGTRNPMFLLVGVARCAAAPGLGRKAGRTLHVRTPCKVRHLVVTDHRSAVPLQAPAAPPLSVTETAAAARPAPPALSGLQLLLAGTTGHPSATPEGND